MLKVWGKRLIRKKIVNIAENTALARCLTTFDLTLLGIGSTLGLGIYVLAGEVAKKEAGPAVTVSFAIAALASVISGLCYAEFGARVPKAGSAYVYSYVTVGEFVAFVIGWNLILEYIIGTASVARGYSGYLDALLDYKMSSALNETMPIRIEGLSEYPDFFSFGISLLVTVLLSVGVKESTRFNNVFTSINLLIVVYVIIVGLFKADVNNWKIPESAIPNDKKDEAGSGGFFPFGFSGVMSGAATCFYGFVGFDCIATTGEEAKNPQRGIPISIILSLCFIFAAYFGVSAVLTLMIPYYEQHESAPIPYAFESVGWEVAKWIVSIGALAGLSTSLLGAMFPLPRILYAMANDGLIFRFLAKIHPKFRTPFIATILAGVFGALMAMLFELEALIDMMSIGTLLAYTLVACSVLILRYQPGEETSLSINKTDADISRRSEPVSGPPSGQSDDSLEIWSPSSYNKLNIIQKLFYIKNYAKSPIHQTSVLVNSALGIFAIFVILVNIIVIYAESKIADGVVWVLVILGIIVFLSIMCVIVIGCQPSSSEQLSFRLPWVPFLPCLSVFVNTFLMLKLSAATWTRFGVWMAIGFAIYFGYGIWHSVEETPTKQRSSNFRQSNSSNVKIVLNPSTVINVYDLGNQTSSECKCTEPVAANDLDPSSENSKGKPEDSLGKNSFPAENNDQRNFERTGVTYINVPGPPKCAENPGDLKKNS